MRCVHGAHGVGGGVPVRPPRGVRPVRGLHPLRPQRPPLLHLPDALRHRRRHQGRPSYDDPWRLPLPVAAAAAAAAAARAAGVVQRAGAACLLLVPPRGMGAYFDDVSQYQEMNNVCTAAAPPSSEEPGGGVVSAPARQADADSESERPLSRKVSTICIVYNIHIHYISFIYAYN